MGRYGWRGPSPLTKKWVPRCPILSCTWREDGFPRSPWRASAVRLDGQSLADNFPTSCTMISEVFLQTSSRRLLFAPLFSRKRLGEAKTSRNSLSRNILQGTSLFSIFCSATLLVTPRKQGFCVQNTGGGSAHAPALSRMSNNRREKLEASS